MCFKSILYTVHNSRNIVPQLITLLNSKMILNEYIFLLLATLLIIFGIPPNCGDCRLYIVWHHPIFLSPKAGCTRTVTCVLSVTHQYFLIIWNFWLGYKWVRFHHIRSHTHSCWLYFGKVQFGRYGLFRSLLSATAKGSAGQSKSCAMPAMQLSFQPHNYIILRNSTYLHSWW